MRHNSPVADYKETITDLADLMKEFRLSEARLRSGDMTVAFRRRPAPRPVSAEGGVVMEAEEAYAFEMPAETPAAPAAPKGTPLTSPMTGIFYSSPSPSAPSFVEEGGSVNAGQIVGLIEAMKVFNEIPCTVSGTVLQMVAANGQVVNLGDVLMYIG